MERYHLRQECIFLFEKGLEKEMVKAIIKYIELYGIHPFKDDSF